MTVGTFEAYGGGLVGDTFGGEEGGGWECRAQDHFYLNNTARPLAAIPFARGLGLAAHFKMPPAGSLWTLKKNSEILEPFGKARGFKISKICGVAARQKSRRFLVARPLPPERSSA